jgi:hypothetical protein
MTTMAETTDSKSTGLTRRRWLLLLFVLLCLFVAAPFVLVLGKVAFDTLKERASRRSFDSAVWKSSLSNSSPGDPVRLRMVDSLLRQRQLIGMSRSEIVSLLGAPPSTEYFRDYDLVYWLGPERGFISIDSEWLAIRLDPNDRVTEARIVRD